MPKNRATPTPPPSPAALHQATLMLKAMRDQLIAIDPYIVEDTALFHDTLDGESDALEVLADMVRAALDAETMAEAAKVRAAATTARAARLERRNAALRKAVLETLVAIDLRRLEREDFTASLGTGRQKVLITDDKLLPDTLMRITREPDKALIGDLLKANKPVAGATLSNGETVLAVRTR
jgi:hypothetical protein